jgi:HD-like signal output (HDOD) protein
MRHDTIPDAGPRGRAFGRGNHAFKMSTVLSIQLPVSSARRFLAEVSNLPPVPQVALRVLSFFEDDTRNTTELARLVSADPALSARLIKVSNSAYYGFPRRLATVREAVLVLGFRQVRQIVLGTSLIDTWRRAPACEWFSLDLFWGHSLVVALGAEAAARMSGSLRPEEAFTAGMLHDIGVLAMLSGGCERLSAVLERVAAGEVLHEAEREVFGFDHAELGGVLAGAWNFPLPLVAAAASHHDANAEGLAGVVAIADQLANANGLGAGFRSPVADVSNSLGVAALERAGAGFVPLLKRSHAFIESVCGAPEQWHSAAA